MPVFPETGPAACPGAVRQTVPGGCGPVVGQIWPGQRGGQDGCLGPPVRGRNPWTWSRRPVFPQVTGISPDLVKGFRSSCVPLGPAVARTHDGQDSRRLRRFLWASGGPLAGPEGLLDLMAGDLVAAGYAVGVDGEQDTHAMPGAGSDLGGRGAGGQPQRQRGMAQVVGAARRLGACPVLRDGCGAGLVPDPAVEAFAERAAAGTAEQPPICGAPEGLQVPAQEAGKLRGDRDRPDGAFRAVFEAAELAWGAVASPGTRRPGREIP